MVRAVDGPLADVRGSRPEDVVCSGVAGALPTVWVALRANVRLVLEQVTLADVVAGRLPDAVTRLAQDPQAWRPH